MRSPNKYGLRHTAQGAAAKHIVFPPSRQQIRARLRSECFAEISKRYAEPRGIRRRIALRLAARRYKAMTTGVQTTPADREIGAPRVVRP